MKDLRILLAGDHAVVRAGLRALIDGSPGMHVVGEAATGVEALRLSAELEPDVIVMDVSMPEMDGATATERLARQQPGVRVLVLTAHENRGHVTRLLQAGAAGYVLKRGAAGELVRAIRTVANGGTWVDPGLAASLLGKSGSSPQRIADELVDRLSEREEEVLRRIAWGESNKIIAAQLGISTKTVETYKARIAEKLQLKTRTEMVRYAVQRGWLSED